MKAFGAENRGNYHENDQATVSTVYPVYPYPQTVYPFLVRKKGQASLHRHLIILCTEMQCKQRENCVMTTVDNKTGVLILNFCFLCTQKRVFQTSLILRRLS
jgi:hypothetical protein